MYFHPNLPLYRADFRHFISHVYFIVYYSLLNLLPSEDVGAQTTVDTLTR